MKNGSQDEQGAEVVEFEDDEDVAVKRPVWSSQGRLDSWTCHRCGEVDNQLSQCWWCGEGRPGGPLPAEVVVEGRQDRTTPALGLVEGELVAVVEADGSLESTLALAETVVGEVHRLHGLDETGTSTNDEGRQEREGPDHEQ